MKKSAHSPGSTVMKLRDVEKLAAIEGVVIAVATKRGGITEDTY